MPTRDVSLQADLRPLKGFDPRARLAARAVAALGLAALLLGLPSLGQAQTPKQVPYFAIQNARLVTVSGGVIENGTIVVANGLIPAGTTAGSLGPAASQTTTVTDYVATCVEVAPTTDFGLVNLRLE